MSSRTIYSRSVPSPEVAQGSDAVTVDQQEAEELLAAETAVQLARVASTYHQLIELPDLAARLSAATGLSTRTTAAVWTTRVLARAAAADHEQGRPPLTALVVDRTSGTVGTRYDTVLAAGGLPAIPDEVQREKHAAAARMECYRWAGAVIPDDGGHPALSPRYEAALTRDRRRAREEAQAPVCPTCFMAIPPTGVCDNCG